MLRGRAGGRKAWPAAQATVNFIEGGGGGGGWVITPLATGLSTRYYVRVVSQYKEAIEPLD